MNTTMMLDYLKKQIKTNQTIRIICENCNQHGLVVNENNEVEPCIECEGNGVFTPTIEQLYFDVLHN